MKKILAVFIFIFSFSIVHSQPFWGIKIPPQAGHAGEALFTNGAGTLYWGPAGGGGGSAWLLSGNSGTSLDSNFIGTIDKKDLVFKRNNVFSGIIASNNTSFGAASNNVGTNTTAFGAGVLSQCTGTENTAIGLQAGATILTGSYNTFVGTNADGNGDVSNAIALGHSALANSNQLYISDSINNIHAVLGGTYADRKVLMCDASGSATWQYVNSKFRIVSADLEEADSTLNGGTVSINNGASNWTFYLPGAGSLPAGFEITINRLNSTSVGTVDVTLSGAGVLQDLSGTYSSTFSLASWGTVGRSMTWVGDGNLIWYLKAGSR